jgi:hypothetical protein
MGKPRKYIKKSADGRFFLCIDRPVFPKIDLDKKTRLWVSSSYLFEESFNQDPASTKEELQKMMEWNEINQNYEFCKKIMELQNMFNRLQSSK